MSRHLTLLAIGLVFATPARAQPAPAAAPVAPPTDARWWRALGDPKLGELVGRALEANGDVRAARARAAQAEAVARQSLGPLLPQVNASVGANLAPVSSLAAQGGASIPGQDPSDVVATGSALVALSYEPDLAGRRRLGWEASRNDWFASQGDRDALALTVSTRVADTYFDLVFQRARLELLDQQSEVNRTLLDLVELRFDTGAATALDVLQQRQQVAASAAQLPPTRSRVRTLGQQLAILVGLEPLADLGPVGSALPAPAPLPEELPVDLLERRPDLRASRARLSAADERATSAVRALFPSLRLSGQVGWQGIHLDELKTDGVWGAGATLSVPIWQGGAEHAAISQARAARIAAQESLRQLALQAGAEAHGAMAREEEQRRQLEALEVQVAAAEATLAESRSRFLAGLGNYLPVLTALSSHQQSQLSLLQVRRELLASRVQLHAALGGAWTEPRQQDGAPR